MEATTVLIADDLKRGRLMSLESLGLSVAMDIVAFFAVRSGDKGELLERQFQALRGEVQPLPDAAARTKSAAAPQARSIRKTRRAR